MSLCLSYFQGQKRDFEEQATSIFSMRVDSPFAFVTSDWLLLVFTLAWLGWIVWVDLGREEE